MVETTKAGKPCLLAFQIKATNMYLKPFMAGLLEEVVKIIKGLILEASLRSRLPQNLSESLQVRLISIIPYFVVIFIQGWASGHSVVKISEPFILYPAATDEIKSKDVNEF